MQSVQKFSEALWKDVHQQAHCFFFGQPCDDGTLSRILKSSLGYILGSGLYSGSLHCRSAWNRADGPSRGADAPGPSRPEPAWLTDLKVGKLEQFDQMLKVAMWSRPLGRWVRLLLLLAGDIEQNPGPSMQQAESKEYRPRGELDLLGGLSQATTLRMRKCLAQFEAWIRANVGVGIDVVLSSAEQANLALRSYGLELFRLGKPRYMLVYTITAVQQVRPEFRRQLAGAWQVDHKWQLEEPGQCRAVLSAPVLRAILCLSLLWGWRRFAGIVALGFGGMLHPHEFIQLSRRDLVFPEDALLGSQQFLFIHIKNPKSPLRSQTACQG